MITLSENATTWKWFALPGSTLEGVNQQATISGMRPAECMQACVNYKPFNCSSVAVKHSTSDCILFGSNRTTLGVTVKEDADFDYFERYFSGKS